MNPVISVHAVQRANRKKEDAAQRRAIAAERSSAEEERKSDEESPAPPSMPEFSETISGAYKDDDGEGEASSGNDGISTLLFHAHNEKGRALDKFKKGANLVKIHNAAIDNALEEVLRQRQARADRVSALNDPRRQP